MYIILYIYIDSNGYTNSGWFRFNGWLAELVLAMGPCCVPETGDPGDPVHWEQLIKGSWEAIFRVTDDFYSSDFTSHNKTSRRVAWDFTSHNNTSHERGDRRVVWDFTLHNSTSYNNTSHTRRERRVAWDFTSRNSTSHNNTSHKRRERRVVTQGSEEEGWWRRVTTKGGDEGWWLGKWWLREVVTKGSGDYYKGSGG